MDSDSKAASAVQLSNDPSIDFLSLKSLRFGAMCLIGAGVWTRDGATDYGMSRAIQAGRV